ncbi:hypothetical protein PTSG_11104 [Salpingoeca rosetta]|uniref:MPN domain-containing protein n=1 Tax=Salpingoeca rosetta (strain ATCC 50818 / BSB-021) TaxID=946362 RepID=F2US55_SALR5|nr:uncharacterized protein PTSG_11104 [Salpingoeca rosetta]EGD80460.1 hypothetical protein PTSG_11104 [Salpingoeca rosetta]|eukprot:XP_004988024.1 hypothetical protein PTSG_11104 [Salpingoeca rosetta]
MALTLRIRTPTGMKRIQASPEWTLKHLYQEVAAMLGISARLRLKTKQSKDLAESGWDKPLSATSIRHGDILTLEVEKSAEEQEKHDEEQRRLQALELDAVDVVLAAKDGKVTRKRGPLCRHPPMGSCLHCTPLEPYDPQVLNAADPPIKFLSFQSFLRKIEHGCVDKFAALPEIDCKVKPCLNHAPWPEGICSKCQPSAVVLNRQEYRHVDYVEFESHEILDKFLDAWRRSGAQRAGFMYGSYEEYDQVPLGVKAVVKAIYEPPQSNSALGLEIALESPQIQQVDQMAKQLGLKRVGWIFTDLEPDANGLAKYKRYIQPGDEDSYVISAEEILNAAMFQNQHPNPVPPRFSTTGVHGSKFTTVVVSGDSEHQIVPRAYQASTQAMNLVRDDILRPSDSPALVAVRPADDTTFVPEVLFTQRDKYNNEIKHKADPLFPVAYLAVDLPAGGRMDATSTTFSVSFPIENREALGAPASLSALKQHLQDTSKSFLQKVSDFHLLVYLMTDDMFVSLKESLPSLLRAVRDGDESAAAAWTQDEHWMTITMLMESS